MKRPPRHQRPAARSRRPSQAAPLSDRGGLASSRSVATRILCVDDHALLVEGLKAQFAIDGDIEVVGRLGSAARLVEEFERLRPDAVLLDIEMPGPDALEMADRLKRAYPGVRLIILSAHVRDSFISASFAAGACAYFSKTEELDDIVRGIRDVMRGRLDTFLLGPKVRDRCGALPASSPSRTPDTERPSLRVGAPVTLLASLTARETEILRLIGKGLSRTQIAALLFRSAKTVDGHQDRIMKKLGITARADLMRFAIREGLAEA